MHPNPSNPAVERRPPACTAAEAGDLAALTRILDADPSQVRATQQLTNVGPHTPLHMAAWQGHLEIARLLLDRGADPNARGEGGRTPLHCAIKHRSPEVVELLLARGADPDAQDDRGILPLDMCGTGLDDAIIAVLERGGARVDLFFALKFGRREAAWEMLRAGEPRPGDPHADRLLAGAVCGISSHVYIAMREAGPGTCHLDPDFRVPITRRVVDEHLDLLDELARRDVPVTRESLAALRGALDLWDPRPAGRLLRYGILRPFRNPSGPTFRKELFKYSGMLFLNPCRRQLARLLREHGVTGGLPRAPRLRRC